MEHPYEVELNFSNICTASCIICSRPHGCGNKPFMDSGIFYTLLTQLKDIDFKIIQTSGNGEAFLNPNYLDYVSVLKREFPKIPRWTYNNFSLWNRERAERIVSENLFDKIHVRIDSLEKWVFERNSSLNQEIVFNNLKYFLSINKKIPVVILYNNINDYYNRCKSIIGKRPARDFFTDEELSTIKDEEKAILKYFKKDSASPLIAISIGHSLWGERLHAPKDTMSKCPKWNVINKVTWISPDGSVIACCYDDRQDFFVCGNITKEHLLSIYNGEKRKEFLKGINERKYTEYPCTNPRCCSMGDEVEIK